MRVWEKKSNCINNIFLTVCNVCRECKIANHGINVGKTNYSTNTMKSQVEFCDEKLITNKKGKLW